MDVDKSLLDVDKKICKNIELINQENVWLIAQNVLDSLRTFVEIISVKVCWEKKYSYDVFEKKGLDYIKWNHKYKFLYTFHQKLQISQSHYTQDEENSKRLMLDYYVYLIKIRDLLKNLYNIDVLVNLEKFQVYEDPVSQEYYRKISEKIEINQSRKIFNSKFDSTYYVWKVKPFFVNGKIYYEIMFSIAQDYVSKFDKLIAFTKEEILPNYSVKFNVTNDKISISWKEIPIFIVQNYRVSIRPCEFKNLSKIFWDNISVKRDSKEYQNLMNLLTGTWYNLTEIINFSDENYQKFQIFIGNNTKKNEIINVLNKCREIIKNRWEWSNILRYLLYNLQNKIIKKQLSREVNRNLSWLYLRYQCIPFDKMPFCTSLYQHNPLLRDLLNCIDFKDRDWEFLARIVQNKNDNDWELYIDIKELSNFQNINDLIEKFNWNLYNNSKQQGRRLEIYKNHIYRKSNEEDIVEIINIIKRLTDWWINNYSNIVEQRIDDVKGSENEVDDDSKKDILKRIFAQSNVALIYWSAWTWKTTLIKHISDLFENQSQLFLANTNPAVNNLRRRIGENNNYIFNTIASCKVNECNILIIDECSTVSNEDILKVLNSVKFNLLVLVWDTYQIESINFWNWFSIIQNCIPNASFTLTKPYRTDNEELIKLWDTIREINKTKQGKDDALERLLPYSRQFDDSIFDRTAGDEIILCLNYDWLYWINNVNRILQWNNKNQPIQWWTHIYKIWDPILFNENRRFAPLLYNNLKWTIINIEIEEDKIFFTIEVDKVITEREILFNYSWLELLEEPQNWKSKIRFYVNKLDNEDDDEVPEEYIVPFQIAYAVSIHKSQWLEYDSVKIIISDEVDERITHNIFYTAITRARKNLTIYRSIETSKKILDNLKRIDWNKDYFILKWKYGV